MMKHNGDKAALFCEDGLAVSEYLIHTPSEFARSSLIYLQEVGTLQAIRPYTTGRNGLNSYLFFTVVSGKGDFIYNGIRYSLNTGDCVFIDCREAYSQITSEDLWRLQWVHFNGTTMEKIYHKFCERGGTPVFHTEWGSQYLDLLNQIYRICEEDGHVINMELAEKLMSLLTLLMKETWNSQQKQKISSRLNIRDVKKYLDDHYMEGCSLDNLAEIFYIDKFYLTKMFKAQYDMTINYYLNRVRITKAKELLRFSNLSIEEIGCQVGIMEPNYFARVFKKIEGITPSVYRAEW